MFKRQKYHCVYEYPREAPDAHSPAAYVPDLSTYSGNPPVTTTSFSSTVQLCEKINNLFVSRNYLFIFYTHNSKTLHY